MFGAPFELANWIVSIHLSEIELLHKAELVDIVLIIDNDWATGPTES
ncbi:unnamed protein product [Acidithrix sp. C25]|nr:unnamed protein product [Acidithrix sp. C25]